MTQLYKTLYLYQVLYIHSCRLPAGQDDYQEMERLYSVVIAEQIIRNIV